MQGVLLTDSSERMDSMNLLRLMAPIAALILLPVTAIAERDVLTVVCKTAAVDQRKFSSLLDGCTLNIS